MGAILNKCNSKTQKKNSKLGILQYESIIDKSKYEVAFGLKVIQENCIYAFTDGTVVLPQTMLQSVI